MHDSYLKYFFYSGYKSLVIAATVALIVATALSFLWRNSIFTKLARVRIRYIIVIASITFAPLTISTLKSVTNVFCPYELSMYNGKEDYIPILSRYTAETKPVGRGRGFPAGHSTSGFAFMSLYFISRDKRRKQLGLMYVSLPAGSLEVIKYCEAGTSCHTPLCLCSFAGVSYALLCLFRCLLGGVDILITDNLFYLL